MNTIGKMRNFKTVTKCFTTYNTKYYIVAFDIVGLTENQRAVGLTDKMYGTINYKDVDEKGMIRPSLCLADLCAEKTVAEAIRRRNIYHESIEFMKEHGML